MHDNDEGDGACRVKQKASNVFGGQLREHRVGTNADNLFAIAHFYHTLRVCFPLSCVE